MDSDHAWVSKTGFSFFDEGAGERRIDLLSFEYDKDASYGMLDRVISGCRDHLSGLQPEDARAILRMADALLEGTKDVMRIVVNGEPVNFDNVDWKGLNQLDFIHLIIQSFGAQEIIVESTAGEWEPWDLTASKFCAAFALRMAFNASRNYLSHVDGRALREYYMMQAAVGYGLMQALATGADDGVPAAVSTTRKVATARSAANKRWKSDPTQTMKQQIRAEWEKWQMDRSTYRLPRDFRRAMLNRFPEAVDGTLKNWMSEWGKENAG